MLLDEPPRLTPRLTWDTLVRRAFGVIGVGAVLVWLVAAAVQHWSPVASTLGLAATALSIAGPLLARYLDRRRPTVVPPLLVGSALVSAVTSALIPVSGANPLPYILVSVVASRMSMAAALCTTAGVCVVQAGGLWLSHQSGLWTVLLLPIALLGGTMRRAYNQRIEQTQLLLAQTERARVAEARTATLAERTRLAREIHDVLAHSLAALAVQLEAADVLLDNDRVDQAKGAVRQSKLLAREGLAETKQAVLALREGGGQQPLAEALGGLLRGRVASGPRITGGPVVEPSPDARFALYRIAQEALTNADKHAPGAAVDLELAYRPGALTLAVSNGPPPAGERPLTGTGGGYGLAGMRERLEPLGGELTAGPVDGGWRVAARLPV